MWCPRLDETIALAHEFAQLVRQQQAEGFDAWLEIATRAESDSLKSFAHGMSQDYAAVHAALSALVEWPGEPIEMFEAANVRTYQIGPAAATIGRHLIIKIPNEPLSFWRFLYYYIRP
jgi:hypothetical protein